MDPVLEVIGRHAIVPVVAIEDAEKAVPLARALKAGGLPLAEITFRTAAAKAAIQAITEAEPDVLVGAGTVLTPQQVDDAIAAGARFLVSPGCNPTTIRRAQERGIPITPGVCTPTDIETALELGLITLKFFPAESYGGLKTLKALAAPYGMVRFVPTGGITAANLADYLAFPKVHAIGGSWMVKADLIDQGRFDEIERLTREAVSLAAKARG